MADILHRAATVATTVAATDEQQRLFAQAFTTVRARVEADGSSPDLLDCVRVPRLVDAAVRGTAGGAAIEALTIALAVLYTGIDLWDDAMDGELSPEWRGRRPDEVALVAAGLIGGAAPMALAAIPAPAETVIGLQRLLARGFVALSAGQQEDIALAGSDGATAVAVERSVIAKSGAAMAMYAAMAARLADAPDQVVAAYANMGRALGTAWQVHSDLQDLFIAAASKDLANGTRTLPIAMHLEQVTGDQRNQFLALLDRARDGHQAREKVKTALREAGILRRCAAVVESWHLRADQALAEATPKEPAATELRDLIGSRSLLRTSR
jgi:geranylgeranyl pyrophosphate synthase